MEALSTSSSAHAGVHYRLEDSTDRPAEDNQRKLKIFLTVLRPLAAATFSFFTLAHSAS